MVKEIDHDCTDEIVCPYCGYEHGDSWEVQSDSGEYECGECGKWFFYERNVSVSYSTIQLDPMEAEKLERFGCRGCRVRENSKCGFWLFKASKENDRWLDLAGNMPEIAKMDSCPKPTTEEVKKR